MYGLRANAGAGRLIFAETIFVFFMTLKSHLFFNESFLNRKSTSLLVPPDPEKIQALAAHVLTTILLSRVVRGQRQ